MIKIATILTCFNRKEKTIRCLAVLFDSLKLYNTSHPNSEISLSVYLTDDACTDGTVDAAEAVCAGQDLHIIPGDGHCYWAGGMRLAWCESMKRHEEWDFYLLLNDDTTVFPNVFEELMECHVMAVKDYGMAGVYSGCTCDENDPSIITYSGDVINPSTRGWNRVMPNGQPQLVDMTNANILLISKTVVDKIGIFPDVFVHSLADQDYGMMARRAGIPVFITSHSCGFCEYDHISDADECRKLMQMTLSQRKAYVYHPIHSDRDYLHFIKRNMPQRYVFSYVLRKIRLYMPSLYFQICKFRGIY